MATRKDIVKKQLTEFVEGELRPDEAQRGGALGQSGPMPGLFGVIGMLFIKQYFVALTSERVLFVRTTQFSGRPMRVELADPRAAARAIHEDGKYWSSMTYTGSRTVKLRYHQLWREEMNVIIHALEDGAK